MYNDIADFYLEIFPLNHAFLDFIQGTLLSPGSTVLDLGCGPGDYIDTLTRAGYPGVGIDNSELMIAQAKVHKQGTFYNLSFDEISQLEVDAPHGFDCAYCVGNSLSYLPEELMLPFLESVYQLLAPSASFLLQVVNWEKFRRTKTSEFPVNIISDRRSFHRHYEWISHVKVIFHTEIQKNGEFQKSWSAPLFPIYLENITRDLHKAGLTLTGQFGDYQKSPFNPDSSPAMILVAKK